MTEANINSEVHDPVDDKRLLERRGKISAYGRARRSYRQLLLILCCAVAVIGSLVIYGLRRNAAGNDVSLILVLLGIAVVGFGLVAAQYTRRHFVQPDQAMRKWLQRVCDGNTDARVDLSEAHPHFRELNFHTRNLGGALTRLSSEMDDLVESQTHRLSEQNRSLDLLFRLTADVANGSNESEVFVTVCRSLANWFGDARAHAYVAVDAKPRLMLTRSADPDRNTAPAADGAVDDVDISQHVELVSSISQTQTLNGRYRVQTCIPFFDNGNTAGVIVIESMQRYPAGEVETRRVLQSTSEQLSLFYAQRRAIEESQTMQAVRERADLAADIHDSLAQTLAAMRYQFSMVEESLSGSSDTQLVARLKPELDRIRATISEANDEARGLIGEYRKPLQGRSFASALRQTVDQIRSKTDSEIFVQIEAGEIAFTQREESQLLKIVGEALNNAIKYAEAHFIRVVLSSGSQGTRRVVIEDDGVGFVQPDQNPDSGRIDSPAEQDSVMAGDHIGLSIMQERAESIGANLNIETEPGEGTRVFVELRPAEHAMQKR